MTVPLYDCIITLPPKRYAITYTMHFKTKVLLVIDVQIKGSLVYRH